MSLTIIRLTHKHTKILLDKVYQNMPIETCGILLGEIKKREVFVRRIVILRNLLDSSTEFKIDPEELLREMKMAEENSMELIGFFHSHPTHPKPSSEDIESMKLWPETIWLIISSLTGNKAAFKFSSDKISKVRIEICQSS